MPMPKIDYDWLKKPENREILLLIVQYGEKKQEPAPQPVKK